MITCAVPSIHRHKIITAPYHRKCFFSFHTCHHRFHYRKNHIIIMSTTSNNHDENPPHHIRLYFQLREAIANKKNFTRYRKYLVMFLTTDSLHASDVAREGIYELLMKLCCATLTDKSSNRKSILELHNEFIKSILLSNYGKNDDDHNKKKDRRRRRTEEEDVGEEEHTAADEVLEISQTNNSTKQCNEERDPQISSTCYDGRPLAQWLAEKAHQYGVNHFLATENVSLAMRELRMTRSNNDSTVAIDSRPGWVRIERRMMDIARKVIRHKIEERRVDNNK